MLRSLHLHHLAPAVAAISISKETRRGGWRKRAGTRGGRGHTTGVHAFFFLYRVGGVFITLVGIVPVDFESRHSRFGSKNVSHNLIKLWLLRWILFQLGICIFIIYKKSYAYKLVSSITTREQYYRHSKDILFGDLVHIGWICLKYKHMFTLRNRSYIDCV
uniref:Uncharacterized protein n=1 Tax=Cacopsylla melanoneura TaxID=428564 RepID=A0A8D8RAV3_9HEMI